MKFQKGNQIGQRYQKGNPSRLTPVEPRMERFSIPEPNGGCYLWLGALSTDGYAQISHNGRNRNAHIVAYELAKGQVPEGLVIDHLCRVRSCVNPEHLEAVTQLTNNVRGLAPGISRNRIDYTAPCPHGHTRVVWRYRNDTKSRQKICLDCRVIRDRKRRLECQIVGEAGPMPEPHHPHQL